MLAGQLSLEAVSQAGPLRELLLVSRGAFRSRPGEGLLDDLRPQRLELPEPGLEVRIPSPQDRVALGGLSLGPQGLAAQDQVEGGMDRLM